VKAANSYFNLNNNRRRALDPSLYRYIWRHSRGEQIFLLLVILVSLPFNWIALEIPKHIVNDAIQDGAFKARSEEVSLIDWTVYPYDLFGGGRWKVSLDKASGTDTKQDTIDKAPGQAVRVVDWTGFLPSPVGGGRWKLLVEHGTSSHANQTARLFEWSISLPSFLGGYTWKIFDGIEFTRLPYLLALSVSFLLMVLINGAFKYVINIRKGILGERMLRRMRFDLFAILMRFRPEDIAPLKPAEVAGMIKDEVDPIGGFIGDAFIQPAFLLSQAGTALVFIMVQSPSMGLAALAVVLVQAVVIPYLRREQIRLGRLRQLASRQLAGRIGEAIETAPALHTFGATRYVEADIGDRLGGLYTIRTDLFKRKFAVKFLNNLLAQVTPFMFFAVGGYFALAGSVNIGQLVAVINAYKDLPPPINDLITWDQQRQDVQVKYEQVSAQFSPDRLLPTFDPAKTRELPAADAPIELTSVSVQDARGAPLLDRLSLQLDRPSHIALTGPVGSGRDILARILGRQYLAYQGSVKIGDAELSTFSDLELSQILSFVGPESHLFPGSIRDNILFAAKRRPPSLGDISVLVSDNAQYRSFLESRRSGNPLVSAAGDWIDYRALDVEGPERVHDAIRKALDIAGALPDINRFGVRGRFDDSHSDDFLAPFVEARHAVRERLAEKGMSHLVDSFDPERYNAGATVGENLLFGVPKGNRLRMDTLQRDIFVRSILEAEALMEPLIDLGLHIAEMAVETFAGLPPDHPVFERYSAIRPEDLPRFQEIVDSVNARGTTRALSASARTRLLGAGLDYVEPRHRLGLVDEAFTRRVLRARQSFRDHLPSHYADEIEFYDPDSYMRAAPVGDNILFGRITYGVANAPERVYALARGVVEELNLDRPIFELGLEFEVGKGGWQLQPVQRARIAIARALIANPQILVMENAFLAFTPAEAESLLASVRTAMEGRTLITTHVEDEAVEGFDRVIVFEGARIVNRDVAELAQSA
jgi:putative ABC transport system ATP-binding protein